MKKNLTGLKIAVCQMDVVPGRPDINVPSMIAQIKAAEKNDDDIIVFPEMCVPGYLIGDKWENDAFVRDVDSWNNQIILATKGLKIALIFGSLMHDSEMKNEDGRIRKYNAVIVAQDGKLIGWKPKTLQPNYRIFDDDRYFHSMRKLNESNYIVNRAHAFKYGGFPHILQPIKITTNIGEIKIGATICEDMWHMDYPVSPIEILAANGADIIINVSCSPWTWQKNRKRHQVVSDLLTKCNIPLVYVNNTGCQNNGKNLVVFDGSSTIYNRLGQVIYQVEPYNTGTFSWTFNESAPVLDTTEKSDVAQMYDALKCGALHFVTDKMEKIVVGLSGGVDSAVTLAFYVSVFGPGRLLAVNMPSRYNSQTTKDLAKDTAQNLGVEYLVVPIEEMALATAKSTGVEVDTLAYENIQARMRMEILAALAQTYNGVFTCNGNMTEIAFGYCTLYADNAGVLALFGNLTKREVYQLGDYMNQVIFPQVVIPENCFTIPPTAELLTNQIDPFHYGHLTHRGYHDEMVRAFVMFRLDPEWFLEKYLAGTLESELRLEEGLLQVLFPTAEKFIHDLELRWRQFNGSVFKRVQAPPIIILQKRSFGFDLRESMLTPYFTQKYYELKNKILAQ